jgi:hypothetical protein
MCSLVLDQNDYLGSGRNLEALTRLSQLEELNLSVCGLFGFPRQLSALTNLRVLYLHNAFVHAPDQEPLDVAPADWEALRPLARLAFLSMSGNFLHTLPPAVAAMSQLQVGTTVVAPGRCRRDGESQQPASQWGSCC